jgi:hypothetical protein
MTRVKSWFDAHKARDGPFAVPEFKQRLYGSILSVVNKDKWTAIYDNPGGECYPGGT